MTSAIITPGARKIRNMYKALITDKIKGNEWWAFLETQDRDYVNQVCEPIRAAERRLREYKQSFRFYNKIRKYANEHLWTDVEPFEVVKVISDKCVEIRPMETKQTKFPSDFHAGGFSGHYADNRSGQAYEYISNPAAPTMRIRLTKQGWRFKSRKFRMSDAPHKFYDYNF